MQRIVVALFPLQSSRASLAPSWAFQGLCDCIAQLGGDGDVPLAEMGAGEAPF